MSQLKETDKIYDETDFVCECIDTGFKIISPLTIESAKFWIEGVKCSIFYNYDHFKVYTSKKPLLILLMPDGEKLFLLDKGGNLNKNYAIFLNNKNEMVELEYIEKHWDILEPLVMFLNELQFVPVDFRTEKLYKDFIKNNGFNLSFIPTELKTEEVCKIAVQQNGEALQYVPDELKTKEICELAVKNNGLALKYVPHGIITEEICKMAVKQNGMALYNNPTKLKTEEVCKLAVQQNGMMLEYVPHDIITEEICKLAVQQNGFALEYLPEDMITKELCELAVQQNGNALREVPMELRTEEIYRLAVENNSTVLKWLPEELQEKLKSYVRNDTGYVEPAQNIKEEYECVFDKIRALYPEKSLSLTM